MNNTVIITRHPALVEYLAEKGIHGIPITHATPEDVTDKYTYGVLPLFLSKLTKLHTEVALNIPAEMRGKELTLEQIHEYATGMHTYDIDEVLPMQCACGSEKNWLDCGDTEFCG